MGNVQRGQQKGGREGEIAGVIAAGSSEALTFVQWSCKMPRGLIGKVSSCIFVGHVIISFFFF